jgi:hypothetical protein
VTLNWFTKIAVPPDCSPGKSKRHRAEILEARAYSSQRLIFRLLKNAFAHFGPIRFISQELNTLKRLSHCITQLVGVASLHQKQTSPKPKTCVPANFIIAVRIIIIINFNAGIFIIMTITIEIKMSLSKTSPHSKAGEKVNDDMCCTQQKR